MSLDVPAANRPPAALPLQFVNIEITPLIGGQYSVAMQATLLDEDELEFVGQDLAHERVATLDEALAIIRDNIAPLACRAPHEDAAMSSRQQTASGCSTTTSAPPSSAAMWS